MKSKHTRRGTIYLMVMATAAIVTVLGLTGLALVRAQHRGNAATIDIMDSRAGARAAVEQATELIDLTPGWRAQLAGSGGSFGQFTVGRGTIQAVVRDPIDGDLTNSDLDPVDVVGTGKFGAAEQKVGMRLTPKAMPMACLGQGVFAGGNVNVNSGVVVGTGRLASNGTIIGGSARITIPARAVGGVSGGTFHAGYQTGVPASAMPATTMFAYYKSIGTEIPASALSGRRIEQTVLSPTINKYSAGRNARGVYWVDVEGNDIEIRNIRIVGTLVVLNCGQGAIIEGSVSWDPVDPRLPSLLIQGAASFNTTMQPLSESAWATNFNPTGAAYQGTSNTTTTDSFPSRISGLVYTSGNMSVPGEIAVEGVIVAQGTLTVTGMVAIQLLDRFVYSPPQGFAASYVMTLAPGSFTQVVP